MAFNPFEWMRLKGKIILPVLTIIIMFIFVLSSGIAGGDLFNDVLPRLFGGEGRKGGSRGDPGIATAYGEKITNAEVARTRALRQAANQYMLMAQEFADNSLIRGVDAKMDKLPAAIRNDLKDYVTSRMTAMDRNANVGEKERLAAYQQFENILRFERILAQQGGQRGLMSQLRGHLNSLGADPEKNKEERQALTTAMTVLMHDLERGQRQSFFAFPNSNTRDALNFILFKRKADKEGIKLPKSIVNDLIARDLGGVGLTAEEATYIDKIIRKGNGNAQITAAELAEALADEYRVFTALGASTPNASLTTPHDFYDDFRDKTAEVTYTLAQVPVKNFVADVKAEPTAEELKALFNKYRTFEADPSRETPGFKDSRKIQLEYVTVDANARRYLEAGPVLGAVAVLGQGSGVETALALAGLGRRVADEVASMHRQERQIAGWDMWYSSQVHDSSVYNPLPFASTVGALFGPNDMAKALNAGVAFNVQARAIETRDRVKTGMPIALAEWSPNPASALFSVLPTAALMPPEPETAVYEAEIRKKFANEEVFNLFKKDMDAFLKKTNELSKDIDPKVDKEKAEKAKAELLKYIAEWTKARDLKVASSGAPRDKFNLDAAPELKALVEKNPKQPGMTTAFEEFFTKIDYAARRLVQIGDKDATLYRPKWFPDERAPFGDEIKKPNHIAWVSEDLPAKTFIAYDAAPEAIKARVLEAWKFQKARELAKKAAEEFNQKAKELAKKDLPAAGGKVAFEEGLANLARPLNYAVKAPVSMSMFKYQPGGIGADVAGNYQSNVRIDPSVITYPAGMAAAMIQNRDKPLGETLTLTDQPVDNYYVATLVDRKEKDIADFTAAYRRSMSNLPDSDPFFRTRFLPEANRQMNLDALARLKAEAGFSIDPKEEEALAKEDLRQQ